MKVRRRQIGFVLGLLFIVGMSTGAFVYVHSPTLLFNAALDRIAQCLQQQKDAVICTEPIVRALLMTNSGADIMDALEKKFPEFQCHYVGHVVGQQLYAKYKSTELAISSCNSVCESACTHGIIGEAFAEALGADDTGNLDLDHLTADDIRVVGRKLCTSAQTCHGVGHGLFQWYGDIAPSLSECGDIASRSIAPFCYSGVFMEYTDVLTSRNVRPVDGVTYPDPENLKDFCTGQPTIEETRACFLFFPRIVITDLEVHGFSYDHAFERLQAMCQAYPPGDIRSACFSGLGSYYTYLQVENLPLAHSACEMYSKLADQAACNFGEITIDASDRQSSVFPYCRGLATDQLKETCYQGIFSKLNLMGVSVTDSATAYCKSDPVCLNAASLYRTDPWEEIRTVFGA